VLKHRNGSKSTVQKRSQFILSFSISFAIQVLEVPPVVYYSVVMSSDVQVKWSRILESFLSGSDFQWVSPPGLTAADRKIIHTIAQEHGVKSTSMGEGRHRVVVVTKEPRQEADPGTI